MIETSRESMLSTAKECFHELIYQYNRFGRDGVLYNTIEGFNNDRNSLPDYLGSIQCSDGRLEIYVEYTEECDYYCVLGMTVEDTEELANYFCMDFRAG